MNHIYSYAPTYAQAYVWLNFYCVCILAYMNDYGHRVHGIYNFKFVSYWCCSWNINKACLMWQLFLSKLFTSVGCAHRGWQEWDMAVAESSDLTNFILFNWVMRDQKCLYIAHKISRNSIMHKRWRLSSCQWYILPYLKHFFCFHVSLTE